MASLVEAKRTFYRDQTVASQYDEQRFGGSSGSYVNAREVSMVAKLLPLHVNLAADVGSGTGRLLPTLEQRAHRVLALDTSLPMLQQAVSRPDFQLEQTVAVQGDAFGLPLRSGSLDAVTCMRVLFHFDDVRPLLAELRRVSHIRGTLICDTSAWSPRSLVPLGRAHWGERVATLSRERFRQLASETGWRVRAEKPCFLISPYMYRQLPLPATRALEQLEPHLPQRLLCRVFWALAAE